MADLTYEFLWHNTDKEENKSLFCFFPFRTKNESLQLEKIFFRSLEWIIAKALLLCFYSHLWKMRIQDIFSINHNTNMNFVNSINRIHLFSLKAENIFCKELISICVPCIWNHVLWMKGPCATASCLLHLIGRSLKNIPGFGPSGRSVLLSP